MISFITAAWQFRRLIGIGLAAFAVIAAVFIVIAMVRSYGAEQFAAGEAKVRADWDRAVVEAERQRNVERRRAAEELQRREAEHLKDEEADEAQIRSLQDELSRALAAHPDLPRIPGGLLDARRRLGAR